MPGRTPRVHLDAECSEASIPHERNGPRPERPMAYPSDNRLLAADKIPATTRYRHSVSCSARQGTSTDCRQDKTIPGDLGWSHPVEPADP